MGELCAEELVGLADPAGNVVGRGAPWDHVSVPDPIKWVVQIAFGNQELLYQKITGAGCCFQGRPMD